MTFCTYKNPRNFQKISTTDFEFPNQHSGSLVFCALPLFRTSDCLLFSSDICPVTSFLPDGMRYGSLCCMIFYAEAFKTHTCMPTSQRMHGTVEYGGVCRPKKKYTKERELTRNW